MNEAQRLAALRIVLIVVGLIALFAFGPLMILWPSGWAWHSGHSDYPLMMVGIYATLGVFLLRASRDPLKHLSLIWFTVWSSVVHGAIMAVQSFGVEMDGARHLGHLAGDVPALFIVAAVLAVLTPRGDNARALLACHCSRSWDRSCSLSPRYTRRHPHITTTAPRTYRTGGHRPS